VSGKAPAPITGRGGRRGGAVCFGAGGGRGPAGGPGAGKLDERRAVVGGDAEGGGQEFGDLPRGPALVGLDPANRRLGAPDPCRQVELGQVEGFAAFAEPAPKRGGVIHGDQVPFARRGGQAGKFGTIGLGTALVLYPILRRARQDMPHPAPRCPPCATDIALAR
jgi:hypothetical protein